MSELNQTGAFDTAYDQRAMGNAVARGTVCKKSLALSNILMPYPRRINPLAREAEAAVERFAATYGIKLPHFKTRSSMSAYLFPNATLERLIPTGKVFALSWFIDEIADAFTPEQRASLANVDYRIAENNLPRLVELGPILQTGVISSPSPTMLERATKEIADDLAGAPLYWRERFARLVSEYLALTVVSKNQQIGSVISYIPFRLHDSGMLFTCALAEFASDCFLPDRVYNNPVVWSMIEAVSKVGSLSNDLFSYDREKLEQTRFNLLEILLSESPFDEAVDRSIRIINQSIQSFMDAKTLIPSSAVGFSVALEAFIAASWYWQIDTTRYRSINSSFKELQALASPYLE
jgi:hypothetical protein